jgi:hypothetical protein
MSPDKFLNWGKIRALLLIGLGLVLLIGSGWLVVNWFIIGQGDIPVPSSLAGIPLSGQTTGQAALREITRLHSKDFPMIDGVVAHYGDGQTNLWVSSTWLPIMAARQVEVMTNRIAEGRSPFTPVDAREVERTTIYTLTGVGQTHYYFQLDRRVIWLAAPPHLAEQSLLDLIHTLQ